MFLFAHVGITLGAAVAVNVTISKCKDLRSQRTNRWLSNTTPDNDKLISKNLDLKSLTDFLDLRALAIGSLLPDIIDKPLNYLGFGDGRFITHSLLVSLMVLSIGLFLKISLKKAAIMSIALGMISHLILDAMWRSPKILFWPLYHITFASTVHRYSFEQIAIWWNTLITSPFIDLTEVIGFLILIGFAWILVHDGEMKIFLKTGKLS